MKEHGAQIQRIEEAAEMLLGAAADWDQLDLRFVSPFGPNHQVRLLARNSTNPLVVDKFQRKAEILLPIPNRRKIALSTDLDKIGTERFNIVHAAELTKDFPENPEVGEDLVEFVKNFKKLPDEIELNPALVEKITGGFAKLIEQGDSSYRVGVTHKPAEERPHIFITKHTIEDAKEWSEGMNVPSIHIMVSDTDQKTTFQTAKDGTRQTNALDPKKIAIPKEPRPQDIKTEHLDRIELALETIFIARNF